MSYNIFKIEQNNITNENLKASQSITGDLTALPFCVLNVDDDILPSEEFELNLSTATPQLVVEKQLYIIRDEVHDKEKPFKWYLPFFVKNKTVRGNTVIYSCVKAGKSFLTAFKEGTETEEILDNSGLDTSLVDGRLLPFNLHLRGSVFGAAIAKGQITPPYIGFLKEEMTDLEDPESYDWEVYTPVTQSTDTRTKAYAYSKDGRVYFSKSWIKPNEYAGTDFLNATPMSLPDGMIASGYSAIKVAKAFGKFPMNGMNNYIRVEGNQTKSTKVGLRWELTKNFTKGQEFSWSFYVDNRGTLSRSIELGIQRIVTFYVGTSWKAVSDSAITLEPFESSRYINLTGVVPANATKVRVYMYTSKSDKDYSIGVAPQFYAPKFEIGEPTLWCGNASEITINKQHIIKAIEEGETTLKVRGNNAAKSYLLPLKAGETYTVEVEARLQDKAAQLSANMLTCRLFDNNPNTAWQDTEYFSNYESKANGTQADRITTGHNTVYTWIGETNYTSGVWAKQSVKIIAPTTHPNIANTIYLQLNLFTQTNGYTTDYKNPRVYIGDEGGEIKVLLL